MSIRLLISFSFASIIITQPRHARNRGAQSQPAKRHDFARPKWYALTEIPRSSIPPTGDPCDPGRGLAENKTKKV